MPDTIIQIQFSGISMSASSEFGPGGSATANGSFDIDYTTNTATGSVTFNTGGVDDATFSGSTALLSNANDYTLQYTSGNLFFEIKWPVSTQTPTTFNQLIYNDENTGKSYQADGGPLDSSPACFLPGTLIRTAHGEWPVEMLEPGDILLTEDGGRDVVTWIGRGTVLSPRGVRSAATPIIVRKNAIADGVPHQDLHLTRGHSLYVDGVLIPAEFLINHRSILWDERGGEVTVYHIETTRHAVLFANGAAAETYHDAGNVWKFRNLDERPETAPRTPYAPVLTGGPVVDAIWRRLFERSAPHTIDLTDDHDLHLRVDGRRIEGQALAHDHYRFEFRATSGAIRICSAAASPDALGFARDSRRLGVGIRQIVLWRGTECSTIGPDDDRLACGFHRLEPGMPYRWTDGDAVLSTSVLAGPVTRVDLFLGGSMRYPIETQERLSA